MIHSLKYKGFISRIASLNVMSQLKIAVQPLTAISEVIQTQSDDSQKKKETLMS